jgi:hypothetical protein
MVKDEKGKTTIQFDAPPLPPPGDARRDELKRRQDDLEQKAEELADKMELHAIDPQALEVENELAQHFDPELGTMLHVTHARPDRAYCWANASTQQGIDITRKKAQGWQLVSGRDKECAHLKDAAGLRRIGDAVLMWMPIERKRALDRAQEEKTRRIYKAVAEPIADIAAKSGGAIVFHDAVGERGPGKRGYESRVVGSAQEMKQELLRSEASRVLGNMLKEEIPGLPIPGKK